MTEENKDRLFKFIIRCQRNHNKPDLYSFFINIDNGKAYVECRSTSEVYLEIRQYGDVIDKITKWTGTAIAAANKLIQLNADITTIDM